MFKKIVLGVLLALVVIVVGLVLLIAMQPADLRVERKATMAAPPEVIFAQVNDFHNWEPWSPWEKLDPKMTRTYEGPDSGTGAIYKWVGNDEVGEGRMTILESRPSEFIKIKLEFLKPFEATHTTEFTFKPEDNKTLVTWNMYGKNSFVSKAFHLLMDMDKMIGADFEKGLANLKSVVEAPKK